jgi:hypothetical protein
MPECIRLSATRHATEGALDAAVRDRGIFDAELGVAMKDRTW